MRGGMWPEHPRTFSIWVCLRCVSPGRDTSRAVDSLKSCPGDNVPSHAGVPLIYFSSSSPEPRLPPLSFLPSLPLSLSVWCVVVFLQGQKMARIESLTHREERGSEGETEREREREGGEWRMGKLGFFLFFWGRVVVLWCQYWVWCDCEYVQTCVCELQMFGALWPCRCAAWVRYILKSRGLAGRRLRSCCCNLNLYCDFLNAECVFSDCAAPNVQLLFNRPAFPALRLLSPSLSLFLPLFAYFFFYYLFLLCPVFLSCLPFIS